jgi:hypothetical protein
MLLLVAYVVADIFDCFTNFPTGFAKAFFYIATGVFGSTLSLEFIIVDGSADSLFSFAYCLIQFSL